MKKTKKLMALLLAAAMALSLAACGKPETLSDTRSEDVGLYIAPDGASVVNRYNDPVASQGYSLDADGNIVNSNGSIVVAAANAAVYIPMTTVSMEPADQTQFPVDLPLSGAGQAQPIAVDLKVTIAPVNATCKEIEVTSDNTAVAEVPIAYYTVGSGSDSVTATISLKAAGTANITVNSRAMEGQTVRSTIQVSASAGGVTLPEGGNVVADPNASASPNPSASPSPNANTNTNPAPTGEGKTGYVIADTVNFRASPSTDGRILDTLAKGTQLTLYTSSNGWTTAVYKGQTGYIYSQYVSTTKPSASTPTPSSNPRPSGEGKTGYVTGENVNFRASASTSGRILDTLAKGTKVTMYTSGNGWTTVVYNGQTGYIYSKYLSSTKPAADPDPTPSGEGRTGYVTGQNVNFRASASTSGKIIDTLAKGTKITIYSINNGWARVYYNGRAGYISADYVSYDEPDAGGGDDGDDDYADPGPGAGDAVVVIP